MATTRPVKHDKTLLDVLMEIYRNTPDRIKFLLHFICLWWLFGLAVVLSVPVIRRYIIRTMTPVVPSFWILAWCWPVMVLYGIFGPHPKGNENGHVVRVVEDEERPLLREVVGRSPDDSAHDGDDEWEDVDDDDDDVDSEEEEQDDHHAYRRLDGGVIYLIRS
ncbi:hypothetical protein KJ359_009676 [Pestalotiopsis sp. 9143b]|nr:hypothetical protein KJ359_009676 [Pestalotiopsis sp. 9143b]